MYSVPRCGGLHTVTSLSRSISPLVSGTIKLIYTCPKTDDLQLISKTAKGPVHAFVACCQGEIYVTLCSSVEYVSRVICVAVTSEKTFALLLSLSLAHLWLISVDSRYSAIVH